MVKMCVEMRWEYKGEAGQTKEVDSEVRMVNIEMFDKRLLRWNQLADRDWLMTDKDECGEKLNTDKLIQWLSELFM